MFRGTRIRALLVVMASAGLGPPVVGARTITVCPSGGDYQNIADAIEAAQGGDEIVVCDGTYTSTGSENRDLDFQGKRITLRSASDDPTACIIDCQGSDQNRHRAFRLHGRETNACVIRGFKIQGGYTVAADPPWPLPGTGPGGAILCDGASPTIINCIIALNYSASQGGAIACVEGANPVISNCQFLSNTAGTTASSASNGGALYCSYSSPVIIHCQFTSNLAHGEGGAIYCDHGNPVISHTRLEWNQSWPNSANPGGAGGAIACGDLENSASPKILNCIMRSNIAYSGGGAEHVARLFRSAPAPHAVDFELGAGIGFASVGRPGAGLGIQG
jgi:predicted outer membrane repeat protein